MADETKVYLVLFKDGHTVTVRAHSFDSKNGIFMKTAKDPDPDVWIRHAEVLAVTPFEREEAPTSSGVF